MDVAELVPPEVRRLLRRRKRIEWVEPMPATLVTGDTRLAAASGVDCEVEVLAVA
jgi:hypothetical protein